MPIYVYQCDACGLTFEHRQRMADDPLVDCPECDGHLHRVIQPVGVVFKGSGFYVTDNRSRSSTALPGKKETSKKETGTKSDSQSAKSDSTESSLATTD
jgi:putative FmdB family regulatory protein